MAHPKSRKLIQQENGSWMSIGGFLAITITGFMSVVGLSFDVLVWVLLGLVAGLVVPLSVQAPVWNQRNFTSGLTSANSSLQNFGKSLLNVWKIPFLSIVLGTILVSLVAGFFWRV